MRNIFDLFQDIAKDTQINMIKVEYEGKAIDPIGAMIRLEKGETKSDDKVTHSRFITSRSVGKFKANLLLSISRDKGSRTEEGEFANRSLIIGFLDSLTYSPVLNVDHISYIENFNSEWKNFDLKGLSLFPVPNKNDIKLLSESLIKRSELEAQENNLTKEIKRLKDTFKTPEDKIKGVEGYGFHYYYNPPNPTKLTTKLIDVATGDTIKTQSYEITGLSLYPQNGIQYEIKKYKIDDLIIIVQKLEEVRKELKEINDSVRHLELGHLEHKKPKGKQLVLNSIIFDIKVTIDKEYSYPPEIHDLIKAGKVEMKEMPSKPQGKWIMEPLEVGVDKTVTKKEVQLV